MAWQHIDKLGIRVINVMARVFGVLACIVGLISLLSAWLLPGDRTWYLLGAALSLAIGIGVWIARPITQSQIDSIRNGRGSGERP